MGAYLDNAATSWPKPEAVYQAVDHFMREVGATPGRAGHWREEEARRIADEARAALARLFHAPDPQGVAFTMNGTQAINMALKGIVRPGDHVVTSSIEHNAMWRPLKALERRGVSVTTVPSAPDGTLDPADVEAGLRPNTRLVAMPHGSNVLGIVLPIAEVGRIAHRRGVPVLVDAAQTAGAYPIDMEASTQNVAGIAGLSAGVRFVLEEGVEQIRAHEMALADLLIQEMQKMPGVAVLGPRDPARRIVVVSVTVEGHSPDQLAAVLDQVFDVATRAGLHCAPQAHRVAGTLECGALRLSPGYFTTAEEIHYAAEALRDVL
jgi:selenocysteine lyase/cysteine desulfurase